MSRRMAKEGGGGGEGAVEGWAHTNLNVSVWRDGRPLTPAADPIYVASPVAGDRSYKCGRQRHPMNPPLAPVWGWVLIVCDTGATLTMKGIENKDALTGWEKKKKASMRQPELWLRIMKSMLINLSTTIFRVHCMCWKSMYFTSCRPWGHIHINVTDDSKCLLDSGFTCCTWL